MKPRHAMLIAAAAAALLLVPRPVVARPQDPERDQQQEPDRRPPQRRVEERVVVTADRLPGDQDTIGSSVSVLDEQQIRAADSHWMPDLLAGLPGVVTAANGGTGGVASVFIRGTSSNHALVLVDGIKVNSPTTGGYDFSKLAILDVERVEVVRGPQGALYGSQALGGVIQIFTRRPEGRLRADLGLRAGSFSTRSARAWLGTAEQRVDWSLGLQAFATDGISAAAADRGALEADGHRSVTADARAGLKASSKLRLDAFGRGFDARTEIDGYRFSFGPADDPNAVSTTRELYAGGRATYAAGAYRSVLSIDDTELRADTTDPDADFTLATGLRGSIRELDWQNEARAGDHTLLAGGELRREAGRIDSATIFGSSGYDESITSTGVYLHDRIALGARVHAMVGGRLEHHSRYGDHFTFRFATSASPASSVSLHASIGSGFRAPSLNDLFYPGFANPDLAPETSLGLDAGVRWSPVEGGPRVDLTVFRNDIDDLVSFGPRGPENLGRVLTRGVEATLAWHVDALDLAASYTLTDATDRRTGLALVRRPRHAGSVRALVFPASRISVMSRLRLLGRRFDLGASGRVELAPYAVWDMAASVDVAPGVTLRARADNLLDADYSEVYGYGVPGRSAYLGVDLRLGGAAPAR